MDKVFLTVLNMSLTGAFVIAAVILARLPLKKAPKIISYCLWAVVGFRLICPFSIEGVLSLMPVAPQPIPIQLSTMEHTDVISSIDSGSAAVDGAIETMLSYARTSVSGNPYSAMTRAISYIWLIGAAVILLYGVVSYALLKRRMRTAIRVEGNLYETDNIPSPFVLGIIKPKIYLPLSLADGEREYIILHERTHIRRHDHIVKFAAYFILCLHWFNPLAWVAFLLMGVDMETSCDERVLKELGSNIKHDYSRSLLSLNSRLAPRTALGAASRCPLAFSEGGLKQRIKNVLNFKKPSRVIIVAAVAFVAVLSVGFAVNRAQEEKAGNSVELAYITQNGVVEIFTLTGEDAESVVALLESIETSSTSRPMDFPRFIISLFYDDTLTATYYFDSNAVVSGDVFGLGNHLLTSSPIYPDLLAIYERKMGTITIPGEQAASSYAPRKWLDYYNPRGDGPIPYDKTLELELPEFPDIVFTWTAYEVKAIDASGERVLVEGLPIHNVFLADVTGDGLPELCATVSMGSGIVDTRVQVYDYAAGVLYDLSDRMLADYSLSLEDGRLIVTQKAYTASGGNNGQGTLTIRDGALVVYGIDRPEQPFPPEPSPSSTPAEKPSPTQIVYQELLDAGCKIEYVFIMSIADRKSLQGVDNGELATIYASYTEGEYGDAIYCMRYDFERPTKTAQWTHSEPTYWDGIALDVAAYAARTYYSERYGDDYGSLVLTWAGTEEAERLFPDMDVNSIAAFTVGTGDDPPSSIILTSPDGQSHWKVIAFEGEPVN